MERSMFPFPLAANSSHHSNYHRFLLGADASVLAPFPKPYCIGALSDSMPRLTADLNLPRWRKLYHGALPWVEGFGPEHYEVGRVAPHHPLPREYGRPLRRLGAFDFVQIADPSVSALALVAGDRRVLDRFVALADDFCLRLESGALSRSPGPPATRATGRLLAGQFAEPSNRWLMPFLHVHSRVLNFTSFERSPGRLTCIDSTALARAGERAKRQWISRQAETLSDLGYRVAPWRENAQFLHVDGVSCRLVAAMEAPRIAVLRVLEKMISGDRPPSIERFSAELPPAVIAAMAEQLESILARSICRYKPAKMGLPPEGPWRCAVRGHLRQACQKELALLDATAARARAIPSESAIFAATPADLAHCHAPEMDALEAPLQLPTDPELGAVSRPREAEPMAPVWLLAEFEDALRDVNERLARAGPEDPLLSVRRLLSAIDHAPDAANPEQLRQASAFLGVELERRSRSQSGDVGWGRGAGRGPLVSLEELFENVSTASLVCERELGGRSL
jgi:hypothetical protein